MWEAIGGVCAASATVHPFARTARELQNEVATFSQGCGLHQPKKGATSGPIKAAIRRFCDQSHVVTDLRFLTLQ